MDEGYISKIGSFADKSDQKAIRATIVWVMKRMHSSKFVHTEDLEVVIPFLKNTADVLIGIPEYRLVAQDMNLRFHEMERWLAAREESGMGWMEERLKKEEQERLG